MARRYIISLTGANRVGVLAAVTTALDELRGNLWEASISVMQPFCSILLTADFPDDRNEDIISAHIRDLCRPYAVEVRVSEPAAESGILTPPSSKYVLTVSGSDKPGMLRNLSTKLAELGVDIRNLYAERCEKDKTFSLEFEIAIPISLDLTRVSEQLTARCQELELTLTLEPFADFLARCGGNLRDSVRATTRV